METPVYECKRGKYILISDLKQAYERRELSEWIFGKLQPLIQGEKGAIIDAVFLEDYLEFLKTKQKQPLTKS